MKRINLFKISFILFSFAITFMSCTKEKTLDVNQENIAFIINDLHFDLAPFKPTEYKLSEINLPDLITLLVEELYECDDLNEISDGKTTYSISQNYVGFDLNIDGNTEIVKITPIEGEDLDYTTEDSDDKKCGGAEGEGWISYGKCMSESCVETKMGEAASELMQNLVEGKCMDVRVKRNSTNAKVCGRLIDC